MGAYESAGTFKSRGFGFPPGYLNPGPPAGLENFWIFALRPKISYKTYAFKMLLKHGALTRLSYGLLRMIIANLFIKFVFLSLRRNNEDQSSFALFALVISLFNGTFPSLTHVSNLRLFFGLLEPISLKYSLTSLSNKYNSNVFLSLWLIVI